MQVNESKTTTGSLAALLMRVIGFDLEVRKRVRPADKARLENSAGKDRIDCGGYNEAFIVQYWAGYNPRH